MLDLCYHYHCSSIVNKSSSYNQWNESLTSWSILDPRARRVSVWGQRGVAVWVGVGESVVVGLCVSHVWKGVTLLLLRVGEDPVECSLKVIVLKESFQLTSLKFQIKILLICQYWQFSKFALLYKSVVQMWIHNTQLFIVGILNQVLASSENCCTAGIVEHELQEDITLCCTESDA